MLLNRRLFVKASLTLVGASVFTQQLFAMNDNSDDLFYMPDESHRHSRTWMAFVANDYIWSRRQIPEVKRNFALIANTIAQYEPVSVLVSEDDYAEAARLLDIGATNFEISIHVFAVDDLWLRDTGPTFVIDGVGEKKAIDFNFNGWGGKQEHTLDKQVASFIATESGAVLERANIVLEGGCFEVDGAGTAIMSKSCILNDNRNPGLSLAELEEELKALLRLEKIIWLEGLKGKDITDGHTDFYARFSKPGEVIVSRDNYKASFDYDITRQNIEILSNSTDAKGRPLRLRIIDSPDTINEKYGVNDFAAGYIGYYVCNGAVIAQKFGDKKADAKAKQVLQEAFPEHIIEQIAIDGIASGGGSIHCATQQEPFV
jgi:agmatine deiminase